MGVEPGNNEASFAESLYLEYLKDRMSVSPEWQKYFDVILNITQELTEELRSSLFCCSSTATDDLIADASIADAIIKPKDDEAFRFFLDEPDANN